MRVLIVRHGASEQRDAQRWPDDSRRPLTARGVRRFAALADAVGRLEPRVDAILSSRWTRAWQTAELLTEHAHWPKPTAEPTLELARAEDIVDAVLARNRDQTVAVVGHEPTLSELVSRLMTGRDDGLNVKLKKGAVVCVDVTGGAGEAELRWMVTPKMLAGLSSA